MGNDIDLELITTDINSISPNSHVVSRTIIPVNLNGDIDHMNVSDHFPDPKPIPLYITTTL